MPPAGVPITGLPVGTVLAYNATIQQSWSCWGNDINSPGKLFQAIAQPLETEWGLRISRSDFEQTLSLLPSPQAIKIDLQMIGPNTYAKPNDVTRIVDGEIIKALKGNFITASNVSSFTLPSGSP